MDHLQRAEQANRERFKMKKEKQLKDVEPVEMAEEPPHEEQEQAEESVEMPECMYHVAEAGLDADENCYAVGDEPVPCVQVIADNQCPEPGGKVEPTLAFTPTATGQVTLTGEGAKFPIEHEVGTTVTHKFSSGRAKLSISENALHKWKEKDAGDTTTLGLVRTKITPAPSVVGKDWDRLCEEFAESVEEQMEG